MIKNIHNMLKELALSHKMIKSFEYNDSFEIQKTGEDLYPLFFVEDNSDTITYEKGLKNYNLTYYIIELPNESYEDYLELKNKIEIINDDILQYLILKDSDDYNSISNINSIFIKQWMSDSSITIRTELTFQILNNKNLCDSPFN